VDVGDCFVSLGREDGEVHRVLLGRVEFGRRARVDACHCEEFAGFQRDAVRLFVFAGLPPLIVAVGDDEAVAAAQ
jgi:hypothetical protein